MFIHQNQIIINKPRKLIFSIFFIAGQLIAGIGIDQVQRLTIDDGLSQNYVSTIIQDRVGYLWIGTKDGLNRYDGYNFTSFIHIPGDTSTLSNDDIKIIEKGPDDYLWIGTNGGGLNQFNRKTGRCKNIPLLKSRFQDTGGKYISTISIKNGLLLAGTSDGLIFYLDISSSIKPLTMTNINLVDSTKEVFLSQLLQENDSTFLAISNLNGLRKYNLSTNTWSTLIEPHYQPDGHNLHDFGQILQKDSILWIARNSGLDKFNLNTSIAKSFTFFNIDNKPLVISYLANDDNGILWLVSNQSLIRFNPEQESYEIFITFQNDWLTGAICIDRSGIIWLGTAGNGLLKIRPGLSGYHSTKGNYLSYLYPELIDTMNHVLGLDLTYNRARDFQSIIKDQNNNYWLASQFSGLFFISQDYKTIRQFPNSDVDYRGRMKNLYTVFEDRNGEIWTTCAGGISRLNQDNGKFEFHRIYPGTKSSRVAINNTGYYDITAIYQDRSGIFWLGTPAQGLVRYDPENNITRFFQNSDDESSSISSNSVLTIIEDPIYPEDILWIGTDGGGLNKYNKKSDSFTTISTIDGLPNNTIYGILPDSRHFLWLSTNMGLCKFDPVRNIFKNFTVDDGLQSNEFNRNEYFKAANGEFFFGGIKGFNHFYPENIQINSSRPRTIINGMTIYDENGLKHLNETFIYLNSELTLGQNIYTITFNFIGLEYSSPFKNQYAYLLEPFNKDWIYCETQRTATYSNLSPGNYKFQVKSANGDGIWDSESALIFIKILPPFWKTWWFYSCMSILSIVVVGGIIKRQVYLVRNKRESQRRFAQQLINSQETERGRIAGELHDGIGQELLIIKNTLDMGLNYNIGDKQARNYFKTATKIVSGTIQEVREISHNLSPQHLEQLGLSTAIESAVEAMSNISEIQTVVDLIDIDGLIPKVNEIIVYRIVQESLSNIIKHSQATKVEVSLEIVDNLLLLSIADNGKGIQQVNLPIQNGIGLAGMYERARMLGGELIIQPGIKNGTLIKLKLPLLRINND